MEINIVIEALFQKVKRNSLTSYEKELKWIFCLSHLEEGSKGKSLDFLDFLYFARLGVKVSQIVIHHSFFCFDCLDGIDRHSSLSPDHTMKPDQVWILLLDKFFEPSSFSDISQAQSESEIFLHFSPKPTGTLTSKEFDLIAFAHKQISYLVQIGFNSSNWIDKVAHEYNFFTFKIKSIFLKFFKSFVLAIAVSNFFALLRQMSKKVRILILFLVYQYFKLVFKFFL